MLTSAQWQAYKNVINSVHDSFNQDIITLRRFTYGLQRYGEDNESNETYTDIPLKCLVAYNVFRTWPMSKETISGQIDGESMFIILNKNYLAGLGYLSSDGNLLFNPGKDKFFLHGQEYRSAGETQVAQAGDEPLLIYIILSREEIPTGTDKY